MTLPSGFSAILICQRVARRVRRPSRVAHLSLTEIGSVSAIASRASLSAVRGSV
jgi:hypothetical protein